MRECVIEGEFAAASSIVSALKSWLGRASRWHPRIQGRAAPVG
jgi:hypothetical protein